MNIIAAFVTLLALSAAFASLRGVGGGAAPLAALCAVMLYLGMALVLGVLVPAGWLLCALAWLLFALALWRRGIGLLKKLLSPGFLLFAAGGLVLLMYFAARQPLFSQWDEFSLWGTAVKLLLQDGASYAYAQTGFFTTMTQSPGLPVLGWFAQFMGGGFVQWKVYWAYGLLYLACAAALLAPLAAKQWRLAVPLAAAGLLMPFFFDVPYHTAFLATTWLSAYGDLPAGLVFGGGLVLYFSARRGAGPHTALWPAALPVAALALIKEGVLPVALVAAGLMAADGLFFGLPAPGFLPEARRAAWLKGPRQWALRFGAAGLWLALPLAPYSLWSRHAGAAAALNPVFAGTGGQTNLSIGEAVAETLGQLLGSRPRTDTMQIVLDELAANFTGATPEGGPGVFKVSMAGSPLATMLVIVLLFALAAVLAGPLRERLRAALACGLLLGGFALYHMMLIVFWAVLDRVGDGVKEYGRYLSSYTTGWFMLGLCLLALCALPPANKAEADTAAAPKPKAHAGRRLAATAAVLAASLAMLVRFAVLVRPGYSVLDYPGTAFSTERQAMARVEAMRDFIAPGGRVFFVHQGGQFGDGFEFVRYHQYFLPTVLDYSITGGYQLRPPQFGDEARSPTVEELAVYLTENGCDYVYIDKIDAGFVESYGALFGPELAGQSGPALYRREAAGLYAQVWSED